MTCRGHTFHAGLAAATALVLLTLPTGFSAASPSRFLPLFVRGHDSNGLFTLRFGVLVVLSPVLVGTMSISLSKTGVSGAVTASLSLDLVARLVGGGVSAVDRLFNEVREPVTVNV